MANFQDNRFFGFSSRTLWVSIAVVGVVIGLFFIPEIIKFQFSSTGQDKKQVAQRQQPPAAPQKAAPPQNNDRAALAPDVLKELNSNIKNDAIEKPAAPKAKQKLPDVEPSSSEGGGLFSGWNMRVKARGDNGKPGPVPVNVMDKLGSKEAQAAFKRGRGDIMKFLDKNTIRDASAREAIYSYVGAMDLVANGLSKGIDPAEVGAMLQRLHSSVLQRMVEAKVDRGAMLEWLDIPVVKMIEESRGGNSGDVVKSRFAPKLVLRSLSIRQRPARFGYFDNKPSAMLTAELAVRGSDVDKIGVYVGGQRQRDISPGRPDAEGFRSFRIRGDANGVWSFVAYDKFGSRPFTKSYSFYPRVRRFRQNQDGTYEIAFKPGSAPNSLDRFFTIGISRGGSSGSHDPSISTF
jgi:hypothetical protein